MKLKITVHGVAYEVDVEVLDTGEGFLGSSHGSRPARRRGERNETMATLPPPPSAPEPAAPSGPGGAVTSPIAGTVVELKCKAGDPVENGQVLLVIEAMKMNTSIAASASGKIKSIPVKVGDSVREGQILVELE